MSKRVRKGNTTIEYEFSEWDADVPRSHRQRSNSVDLLQELRRSKKVHAPTQTNMARFSEHYEAQHAHVVTVPNEAPNPTYARSFRYGKEPNKPHCHEWKRRPDTLSVARGVQCDIKPAQRTTLVQCSPATRDMNIQTHRGYQDALVVVRSQSKDRGVQTGQVADTSYEELLSLIRGLKKAPEHNPEGIFQQIAASLAELMALLRTVHKTANQVDAKEDEILSAVRNKPVALVGASTGGEFSQDALLRVAGLLDEIHILIKGSATQEDASRLTALIQELNKIISALKEDSNQILLAIRALAEQKSGDIEGYFQRITTYLKEILELLQVEEEEDVITRRQLYDGKCRCAEIADATNAISKGIGAMLPSLCQRCINDFKGRTFVQSLNLPMALSAEVVNTLGKTIECIERDDEFNMTLLLGECKRIVGSKWEHRTYQVTYEALFHLSLLWRSQKTTNLLGGMIEVGMMVKGMKNEEHRYRLPDYIQKAISLKNVDILETLFDHITEQEKVMIINTPFMKNGKRKFPLFAAARVGDSEIFNFLVRNGAALDVRESDRTILHEIAWISSKKTESPKLKEWNKVLVSMLGVIYDRSGHWWERQLLHAAWTGCTEASRLNALNYLFSIPNTEGLNALQFAARHATPEVIRKIVCNAPYEFIPDPLEFGHDNGLRGYVVDQIESRLGRKNHSVLERMLLRDPLDGAGVMAIEPFKSMIDDKWKRFRIFYGIWFICYLCYMFVYTWCALERPLGKQSIGEMYQTSNDYARLIGEIIVLFFLPMFLYGEIRDGISLGFVAPRPWLRTGIFRILNVIFIILTITAVILRLTLNPNEDKPLGLSLLLGWLLALEFLGAWQCIGMFAIIMHKVVALDVALRFFLVWLIALTGTSAATYVAYQQSHSQILDNFPISNSSFWYTPLSLTRVSLAVLQADYVTDAADPPFGVVLFIIFAFLFNFVLFSLAIAMMADTYSRTRVKIITSWIWVKANFALLMDRRLPNFLSISYVENQQSGFSSIAPTKLRYLTRVSKRRVKDGRIVEATEHVVLVAKEDLPKGITVSGRDLEILSSGLLKPPTD